MRRAKRLNSTQVKVIFAGAVVRRISRAEFEKLRDRGRAMGIHGAGGELVGCTLTNNHPGDGPIPSQPGGPAISAREMELFAGIAFRGGKARTARLTEEKRRGRSKQTRTPTRE